MLDGLQQIAPTSSFSASHFQQESLEMQPEALCPEGQLTVYEETLLY
jgi:hypothetical protein